MNNLYNKIYEAVNTGIQKALIVDQDKDVSVSWYTKQMSSNFNIFEYVKLLLDSNNADEIKNIYEILGNLHNCGEKDAGSSARTYESPQLCKFQDKNVQHIFEYCDCEEEHIIRTMCDKNRNDMFLGSFLANSFFENSLNVVQLILLMT